LQEQIRLYREFVGLHPELSVDIAYTRALAREKLSHRAYAILENGDFTEVSNAVKVPANAPPVNVIFSGQGAQWPEMGKDLIHTDRQFREDIAKMDRILQGLRHPPSWTIMGKK
jgi:acyl transferase domain-containing protein